MRLFVLLAALLSTPALSAQPADAPPVIYEVFVRNFSPEGTFDGVTARLDELDELGVDVLWLMPVYPIGEVERKGTLGSPYAVLDYKALNPRLGDAESFQRLVDEAHARGLRVILDFVANHTAWDHPWVDEHPDWYTRDSLDQMQPPVPDWADVADLDYTEPALREAMTDALRYWVETYDVDGYRADVAEMVPQSFWSDALAEVRALKPDALLLAEGAEPWLYDAGFDLTYAWDYYSALKEVFAGASATLLEETMQEALSEGHRPTQRMYFTTNHDETAWDASPVDLFGSQQAARAAFALAALRTGAVLVYNGQEAGLTDETGLFEQDPIRWEAGDAETRAFYETLLNLRQAHPQLRKVDLSTFEAESDDVVRLERHVGEGRLVALVNVRAEPQRSTSLTGTFRDVLTGEPVEVDADGLALAPYEVRLLEE